MKIHIPVFDEQQLNEVKLLIDQAANLMEENSQHNFEEINELAKRLEILVGKPIDIFQFNHYWSHSSLDDVAKLLLMPEPPQCELSDEDITNTLIHFFDYLKEYGEAGSEYVITYLAKNTGLNNMIDYIYHPSEVGLILDEELDEEQFMRAIANKIIEDRDNPDQRQRPNVILL
ncbi:hypothetical protein J2Z32_000343 [Paenibacillus turicensis]|uniref:Uncharacterized protein n=1 Tax=Paenibacillus turicensis TaxID=160487 RepID=A0ABS4FMB8_9BACL|nr:hypothetical protein [Paenibacillus turicensis]MBP1903731.1 hypothetical protein [Paenibacillus turicensis]